MGLVGQWLTKRRGQNVKFVIPKKGQKERLVELAAKNALLVLSQDKEKIKREELKTIGAMNQVGEWHGAFRSEADRGLRYFQYQRL